MLSLWMPALLVLALGLVYAVLDAWWMRRRAQLERERRQRLWSNEVPPTSPPPAAAMPDADPAGAATPAAAAAAPQRPGPGLRADRPVDGDASARAPEARTTHEQGREGRESDMPA